MADEYTFNTPAGQTIARELLIAYLNVADAETAAESPEWAPIGKRVEDSSMEFDWSEETIQDILGSTYTTAKKPTITQSFDPLPLDASDKATGRIWNLAIYKQDAQALANQDMLIAHFYTKGAETKSFAERYNSCFVRPTSEGGKGGGNVNMPIDVTYGGTRTLGTVENTGGVVKFTPAEAA